MEIGPRTNNSILSVFLLFVLLGLFVAPMFGFRGPSLIYGILVGLLPVVAFIILRATGIIRIKRSG